MPLLFPLMRGRQLITNQRANARGIGPLRANLPMPTQPPIYIRGTTKDSTGAALASVALELFRVDGTLVERLTSDGSGNYVTSPVGLGQLYQVDAYKTGSPDVAGTTANTLQGT